jgi:glutamate formiminotransferase
VPARLLECVPNISEGRDRARLDALVATARAGPGVRFANLHADPDHHRAVLSFLGAPAAVEAAALALAARVIDLVDLRQHAGVHPRIGALDVLPFVPLTGLSMDETVVLARRVGAVLAERHRLPVYFYGHAATTEARRRLPDVRRDGYEGLAARLGQAGDGPDAGPARFDPRSGAILVGAREILVAFNVWLDTDDLGIAWAVARLIRESSGGLSAVQALGVPLPSRRLVQVSMNLLDYRVTPIPAVFDRVRHEAARLGAGVRRGELVGLAPRAAFAGRTPDSVGLEDFTPDLFLDDHIAAAR